MKVTPTSKGFTPVTLSFTFDTQEELDTIGTLFNYSPIASAISRRGIVAEQIYGPLHEAGANISNVLELEKLINRFR